jgi:hypothetical protein
MQHFHNPEFLQGRHQQHSITAARSSQSAQSHAVPTTTADAHPFLCCMQTFEGTIRILGGLLSAFYHSWGDQLYLNKAIEFAER